MGESVKLSWAVPKSDDFDLKDFALGVLEIAKENLQRDGQLVPAAFVITGDQIQCFSITFKDHDEKDAAYRDLVKAAQAAKGMAVITCNDAYRSDKGGAAEIESYYPGKLAAEGAKECIMLTVSGPAIQVWCVEAPYDRAGKEIKFGNHSESAGDEIGFLEGWAAAKPRIQ